MSGHDFQSCRDLPFMILSFRAARGSTATERDEVEAFSAAFEPRAEIPSEARELPSA